jgi:hypothetical protein
MLGTGSNSWALHEVLVSTATYEHDPFAEECTQGQPQEVYQQSLPSTAGCSNTEVRKL